MVLHSAAQTDSISPMSLTGGGGRSRAFVLHINGGLHGRSNCTSGMSCNRGARQKEPIISSGERHLKPLPFFRGCQYLHQLSHARKPIGYIVAMEIRYQQSFPKIFSLFSIFFIAFFHPFFFTVLLTLSTLFAILSAI